jgi:glycosyltransferase involved in cell wall biosynthesis
MPNVLLLCEFPTLNGGEQSMLATLEGVAAAGFQPRVLCPSAGPLAVALHDRDVETVPFDFHMPDGVRRPQQLLRTDLAQVFAKHRPDLVHANSLAMGRLSGPVTADLHIPSISHLRDIIRLSGKAIDDLNCHTRLLAVSHAVRDFHVAYGLSPDKIHVLYNGVDLNRFHPRPPTGWLHRELEIPSNAMLVGAIGQLGLRKGQEVLLQAAQSLADRLPNAHYILVGERNSDKDESRRFEAQLHAAGHGLLEGRVHFLGVRRDVDRLLNELTLLVHTARQEPLGRVLLEASACGVAVIATDVGGTREIFPGQRECAWLIPPDDVNALGDAMMTLLCEDTLRLKLGQAARRRAEQQFDIGAAVSGLLSHYRAVTQANTD